MSLSQVMQRVDIWRGGEAPAAISAVPSGFAELDAKLPGGGFPLGALTEVLSSRTGIGELSLVLRAAAALTRERWLVLIAPPHIPYAPALVRAKIDLARVLVVHARQYTDTLWAVEQALRAGTCGAVLAWPSQADFKWLRRLQLAAEGSEALCALFMSSRYMTTASPAALRLALEPVSYPTPVSAPAFIAARPATGLAVRVVKCRGGLPTAPLRLEVHRALVMSRPAVPATRNLYSR
jgi:hypothetical protein